MTKDNFIDYSDWLRAINAQPWAWEWMNPFEGDRYTTEEVHSHEKFECC